VQANCSDGEGPIAGLIQAADGNLYGTTQQGGLASVYCIAGCGTIFKISLKGAFTLLHQFAGYTSEGSRPTAGLVQANNGILYGTTYEGGANDDGTIYGFSPGGTLTTLHSFSPSTEGAGSDGPLVIGNDGTLYGTASQAGSWNGGTAFKFANYALTVIYSFCSPQLTCSDGAQPEGGLTLSTDGNFYGITTALTTHGEGSVFQLTSQGTLTTLHTFCPHNNYPACPDGSFPLAGPIQATNGKFYGTTSAGGDSGCDNGYGCGTVFSIDMGLGPFVNFIRNPAKVGQSFGILGNGLKGTTAVSLNGTAAPFTIKSGTLIVATVPAGATDGYVTVNAPTRVLTSNVPFHVIP